MVQELKVVNNADHARLSHEARTAARVNHPNVVDVYSLGLLLLEASTGVKPFGEGTPQERAGRRRTIQRRGTGLDRQPRAVGRPSSTRRRCGTLGACGEGSPGGHA